MYEIIKNGVAFEKTVKDIECDCCGCVIRTDEYLYDAAASGVLAVSLRCPQCRRMIVKEAATID